MDVENANCRLRVSQCADMELLPLERPLKIDREIICLEMLLEALHSVFSHDYVDVHDVQRLLAAYKSEPKDWKKYAKFDRFRYTRNLVDSGNGAFNVMILCWGAGHASAVHDHADAHCFMKVLRGSLEEVRYDWPEHTQPEVFKTFKMKSRSRCISNSDGHTCDNMSEIDSNCGNSNCQNGDCQNGNCQNGSSPDDSCRESRLVDHGQSKDDDCYEPQHLREIGRNQLELNDVCYINDALGLHRVENPSHVEGAVSLHVYCPPFGACRVFDTRTGTPNTVRVTYTSVYGRRVHVVTTANDIADSQQ